MHQGRQCHAEATGRMRISLRVWLGIAHFLGEEDAVKMSREVFLLQYAPHP